MLRTFNIKMVKDKLEIKGHKYCKSIKSQFHKIFSTSRVKTGKSVKSVKPVKSVKLIPI